MEQHTVFHKILIIWITTMPINYYPSILQTQKAELRENT